MQGRRRGTSLAMALVAMALLGVPGSASAAPTCDLYANSAVPGGGNGLATQPFNSVQALVNGLAPGQTGCLTAGSVFTETVRTGKAATPQAPIRIVSESQTQPAVIQTNTGSSDGATLRFDPSSAYIEFAGVVIRGALSAGGGSPAVIIGGTGNKLLGTEITHAVTTCVSIGINAASRAVDAVLDGVSVHSCGRGGSDAQASGIAISNATGTRVTNSYVFDNPARGVQLYPDAQRSVIANNVIDGQRNGMGDGMGLQFAGSSTTASNDNLVENNVISNNESYEVGFNWDGPVGTGNVLRGNCLFHPQNSNATIQPGAPRGFSEEGNSPSVDPIYVNRAAPPAGFALSPGTPCGGDGPVPQPVTGAVTTDVDPEAKEVVGAFLTGTVDAHLQPAGYAFALDGREVASGSLPPLGLAQDLPMARVTGLTPSTSYEARVVGRNGGHTIAAEPVSFTTPAPPPITPPVVRVGVTSEPAKGGVKLTRLNAAVPTGTSPRISCSGTRCPFQGERLGLGARSLLLRKTLPPRTIIRIHGVSRSRLGRYNGSGVSLTVTPKRSLVRRDYCLRQGRPSSCLRVQYKADRYSDRLVLKGLKATRVSVGSTLWARCVRGKCAKPPACRVFKRTKSSNLLPSRKQRTMKRGSMLEIRIHKPDTRGIFTRISFPRGDGPSTQTYGELPAAPKVPRSCRDA